MKIETLPDNLQNNIELQKKFLQCDVIPFHLLNVKTPEEFQNLCKRLGVEPKTKISLFEACKNSFFDINPKPAMFWVHWATKLINISYQDKLIIDNNSPYNMDIYIGYKTYFELPTNKGTLKYFTKNFEALEKEIKMLKERDIKNNSSKTLPPSMKVDEFIMNKKTISQNLQKIKQSVFLKDFLNEPKLYNFLETDGKIKPFLETILNKFSIRAGPYLLYNSISPPWEYTALEFTNLECVEKIESLGNECLGKITGLYQIEKPFSVFLHEAKTNILKKKGTKE